MLAIDRLRLSHWLRRMTASERGKSRLPNGAGGHRVEGARRALSQRAVHGVGQVEEPSQRGGAAGT